MSLDEKRYCPNGRVVVRRIGEDTLLVPVSGSAAGGRVFPVNESALTVWTRLCEGGSVQSVIDSVVAHYGIEEREAAEDVQACVERMLADDLLVAADKETSCQK